MWAVLIAMAAAASAATPGEPAGHRIGVRIGADGVHAFYDRETGAAFVPRGFSYVRLSRELLPASPHASFTPGHFDLARDDAALAAMAGHGYNTVRVLISGAAAAEDGALSEAYMANLAAYLGRVRAHDMQALLVMPIYVPSRHPENAHPDTLAGANWLLLAEEAAAFREAFMRAFVVALRELGAPMDAVLAFDLSEWHFVENLPPFSLDAGAVVETIAGSRVIEGEDDAMRMMREGFAAFCNRMAAAVKSVSPDALVGIDLFPSHPFPGDPRFHDVAALLDSDLDYIGLQLYPHFVSERGAAGIAALFDAFGLPERPGKPLLMEEFGWLKRLGRLDEAEAELTAWIAAAEQRGVRGWLLWTYDCAEQADPAFGEDFWLAVDGDGRLLRSLAADRTEPSPDGK